MLRLSSFFMSERGLLLGASALVLQLTACGSPSAVASNLPREFTACTVSPDRHLFDLSNVGDAELTFTATISPSDSPLAVTPAAGRVAPGQRASLELTGTAPNADLGASYDATLRIETNDSAHAVQTFPLHLVTRGAVLATTTKLDFGEMPVGVVTPPLTTTLKNTGNASVMVALPMLEDFQLGWTSNATEVPLDPGAEMMLAATFRPSQIGDRSIQWKPIVKGNVCGEPDTTFRGKGVEGVIGVTPGTVDFGLVACGTGSGLARQVSVINASKQPYKWSGHLNGQTSVISFVTVEGALPPESTTAVDLVLNGIPPASATTPNLYGATLTIDTGAPKDMTHVVDVRATAYGAILSWSKGGHAFGPRELASTISGFVELHNDGNAAAVPSFVDPVHPFHVVGPQSIPPGLSAQVAVDLAPIVGDDLGDLTYDLEWSTQGPLCAPLPPPPGGRVTGHVFARTKQVAAGNLHACAIETESNTNMVYCWGLNNQGYLGDGTTTFRDYPVASTTADAVFAGMDGTCAIRNGKVPLCWGVKPGNGPNWTNTPVAISANVTDAVKIVFDRNQDRCVLTSGGHVWCWGYITGNGGNSWTPVEVNGLTDVVDIAAAYWSFCAVRQTGAVVCWGTGYLWNDGSINSPPVHSTPSTVIGISGAKIIGGGGANTYQHYCVVRASGQNDITTCWGGDGLGEAGPVDVPENKTPSKLFGADNLMFGLFGVVVDRWGWPNVSSPYPLSLPNVVDGAACSASGDENYVFALSDGTVAHNSGLLFPKVPGFD